jgi:hypothetical protein
MLGHNLTSSASVTLQGSTSAGFATIGFTQVFSMTTQDFIWISPTLPLTSYRYWRLLINDGTNTNAYLEIGIIVFGSSLIFEKECMVDRVIRSTKHFVDKVDTEGYRAYHNDRGVKKAVSLEFKNLAYNKNGYNILRRIFDEARTSQACLWIPTPQFPTRFAVFGKLTQIPDEVHNVKGETIDYIDFDLTVDESL